MKKLFTLGFIFLLLNVKSYSQTQQFPFYGFELSNYEVGDTLEYQTFGQRPIGLFPYDTLNDIYRIISKRLVSNDTTIYTMEDIFFDSYYNGMGHQSGKDTLQVIITNDTVYNNHNNLTGLYLRAFDTSFHSLDTSCYVRYDTTNGLKKLLIPFECASAYYTILQNLGVIHYFSQNYGYYAAFYAVNLVYAHLYHYGIYGDYHSIISAVNNPINKSTSISIRYNNGNSLLFISSTQNLLTSTLSIYDLLGRELKTTPVNIGSNPINLNNFAKGMYLYKVTSDGNVLGQGKLMNL